MVIRWTTLKGLAAIILFLVLAIIAEYIIVLYAMDLGASDPALLKIEWPVTITISPLFQLVPIAVIITLAFNWTYLTKKLAVKPQEIRRGKIVIPPRRGTESKKFGSNTSRTVKRFFGRIKSTLLKVKGVSYLSQKIHFARVTIKSALTVLLTFLVLALIVSLIAYPQLIYRTVSSAYQNNPSLLNFVLSVNNSTKAFAESVPPVGWITTAVNNVLLAISPAIRDSGLGFGGLIKPLATLDNDGKYLVFQNAAAWICVLLILFYGEYMRKGYRYKKK